MSIHAIVVINFRLKVFNDRLFSRRAVAKLFHIAEPKKPNSAFWL